MTRDQIDIPMIIFAAVVVACVLAAPACALVGLDWTETVIAIVIMLSLAGAIAAVVRAFVQ